MYQHIVSFIAEYFILYYMDILPFIRSSVNGRLGYFWFSAIIIKAVMNIPVQIFTLGMYFHIF